MTSSPAWGTPVANLLVPDLADVAGAVTLGPATLPADTVNVAYNQTLTASGGTGSITLAVSNIQNAIAGLVVPASGSNSLAISGTPTATGTETFTVTATDTLGDATSTNYSITVNPAVTLGPATLPADTVNVAYNQTLTASGGTGSITLAVSNIQNAIAGLTLPAGGSNSLTISGTPTAAGTETFTVTATDTLGATTSTNYSITVNPAVSLGPATLPADTVNVAYNQTLTASGGTGTKTLAVSNIQNAIAGLTLPAGGSNSLTITGTPTAAGTETFTVTATDTLGATTATNYSITVNPAVSLGPPALPADTVNVAYNQTLTASGGTGSITLAVSNIQNTIAGLTVPAGGSNGLTISGTPTATGTETFTVTATDSLGAATSTNYSITVNAAVALGPPTLPAGTVSLAYNQTLTASGGTGSKTLAVTNVQNAIAGLTVPTSGSNGLTISGTPTATGTETFTVTATDTLGAATSTNYSITVNPLPLSDGFESGNFSVWPWQLSSAGTAANWAVESTTVHSGGFAAQSGAVGPASSSTLSATFTVSAGEISFWRKVSSATGSGSLGFAIDGVSQLQVSGTIGWQQSFCWVSAGQHTFSWGYSKNAGAPTGNDFAWLDDVQFTPGTTLTIAGTSASDQFSFNAGGPAVTVSFDGESHSFAAGEFTSYVFHAAGGTATLTAGAGANSAVLYANGSGQLNDSTAGYAVAVDGMAAINVNGHAGDVAQFFDSPGNDTFYAYADYNQSGKSLAGMIGSGYANTASGFGTNIGYATNGGSDTASLFDSPGNDTFCAYADYNQSGKPLAGMFGSGYCNLASGFGTNVGYATNGGSDTASLFDSPGNDTYYACADYNQSGKSLSGMFGGGYYNLASGFGTNVGYSTAGGSDTAELFDSPGNDTFYAYGNYNQSGKPLAGMIGSGYSNLASGFAANDGFSTAGGSDTAEFFDSPGNDTFYAYADYNQSGKPLAGMLGTGYSNLASGFGTNVGYSTAGGSDAAELFDSPGNDTFYAYANYNQSGKPLAGMIGSGYANTASGFGTNIGYATNGGNDTADLYGSSGNNTLYADLAIALLYGNNYAEASGFQVVNATGASDGVNTKGHGPVNYQLNYLGTWVG